MINGDRYREEMRLSKGDGSALRYRRKFDSMQRLCYSFTEYPRFPKCGF